MSRIHDFITGIAGKNTTLIYSLVDYGIVREKISKDKWGKPLTTFTLPKILNPHTDSWGTYYLIKPLSGTEKLWEENILRTFLETPIKIITDNTNLGWLKFYPNPCDPLTQTIYPHVHTSKTGNDKQIITLGLTEKRTWWNIQLQGTHLLIAGATGSGKGSILWSLIYGMKENISSGITQLWVIDPKGGMELGLGQKLFTRFTYSTLESHTLLLREAVDIMHTRAEKLRGTSRLHTPTVAEPLIVVIVDELAALTAYVPDRKLKTEIETLLSLLLSQGRAVGVSVIAALQDPSKDVLPFRHLFPTRIGLRMTEKSQTQMILGIGAHEAGAYCELISEQTPGVGYMIQEGTTQALRVRAFHITDNIIQALSLKYPAPRKEDNNA